MRNVLHPSRSYLSPRSVGNDDSRQASKSTQMGVAHSLVYATSRCADEGTPLVGEESTTRLRIAPAGSVYDYILFVVPVSKARYGSVWSTDVREAFFFFVMNILLQLLLTFIAGHFVLTSVESWRFNLVSPPLLVDWAQQQVFSPLTHRVQDLEKDVGMHGSLDSLNSFGNRTADYLAQEARAQQVHRDYAPGELVDPDCAKPFETATASFLGNRLVYNKPGGSSGGSKGHSQKDKDDDNVEADGEDFEYRPSPLCSFFGGKYSCSPTSVTFAKYWDKLDHNHDGKWSLEEANEDVANLKCRLHMRPLQIFKALKEFLLSSRVQSLLGFWTSPSITKAIPRFYFDIWQGVIGLCIHSDTAMCGTLVLNGLFDEALSPKSNSTRIKDLNSAMQYCNKLLNAGGLCDQALPQTYQLYKARHAQQCGEAIYVSGPVYKNPYDTEDRMYVTKASYAQVQTYEKAWGLWFWVFQFCVILIWFVSIIQEVFELRMLIEFVAVFPQNKALGLDADLDINEDLGTVRINAISGAHRIIIILTLTIRLFLTFYVGRVGTAFLIADTDYLNLLLNAVALVFIFEIDELLYMALGRTTTKIDIEQTEPLEFDAWFPETKCIGRLLDKDFWGMFLLPLSVACIVAYYAHFTTRPIIEALRCACNQEGEHCLEATSYDKIWYDDYWRNVLPAALNAIEKLRSSEEKS